jgi:tmRNA-binding protein
MKYHPLPAALEQYRCLEEREAAALVGVSVQTLRNWRSLGIGPAYTKPNKRNVRYITQDIFAYMNRNRIEPDPDRKGKKKGGNQDGEE